MMMMMTEMNICGGVSTSQYMPVAWSVVDSDVDDAYL